LFPEQYFCKNCGYRGPIVMEIEKEEKKKTKDANLEAANPTDASDSCSDS
jgi:C4-type Zn-finger protein